MQVEANLNNSIWNSTTKMPSTLQPTSAADAYFTVEEQFVAINANGGNITQGTATHGLSSSASDVPDNSKLFILIPLAVFGVILLLSALVYMMARSRRPFVHIYNKRKPMRDCNRYDESDAFLIHDDIDDPTECLLKGRLQINNTHRYNYSTTQVTQLAQDTNSQCIS